VSAGHRAGNRAEYSVILVYSTSHAIGLEKLLTGLGIHSRLIPVPRHLSSDCGVCIRIERSQTPAARRAIAEAGFEIEGLYEI
jgi:hypothetical protein